MKRVYWFAGVAGTLALIQTAGAITFGRTSGTTATTTSVTSMTTATRTTTTTGGFGSTSTTTTSPTTTTLSPIVTGSTTVYRYSTLGFGRHYMPAQIISNPRGGSVTNSIGGKLSGGKHVPDTGATGTLLSLGLLSVAWLKRKFAA